ncbi:hypothetical protein FBQ97_21490 [Acidobacteria bacterium ACD]|nr:MAG: hypothetical protein EDX89_09820 [Acidobacteriota bacterium]MCE7960038.1 hypothetical protein [Acidobacteria bacterium ACB2]MDL1952360.1 hypothetical protein [Acidobacteria bacterium ACD]
MRRLTLGSAATLALAVSTACASGSYTNWKNPDAAPRTYERISVIALAQDPQVRRTTENMFLRSATGQTKVVPSYTFTTAEDMKSKEAVLAKLRAAGVDGVVVFRVIAVDERTSETVGVTGYATTPYYGGFGAYYGYYGVATFGTVYTSKEQIVQIETTFYSVAEEKLVWVSQAKLDTPNSTLDVIEGIVDNAARAMKKEKLIQ